ncbi:MAG: AAA family ATPase [Candidatus Sabulitectum sp.]|nr:AAA family ATPase [Candidatus Sabulitectum sp.]
MKKLIVLNGLPGTGKTTIGKRLSEELNAPFVNSDTWKHDIARVMLGEVDYANVVTNSLPYSDYLRRAIQMEIYNNYLPIRKNKILVLEVFLPKCKARNELMTFARENNLTLLLIEVVANDQLLKSRLVNRDGTSDTGARWETYLKLKEQWEPLVNPFWIFDTSFSLDKQFIECLSKLHKLHLP